MCVAQAVATPPKPAMLSPSLGASSSNGNGNGNGYNVPAVVGGQQSIVTSDIAPEMEATQARLIALAEASFPINEKTPVGTARQELGKDEYGRVKALSTFSVRGVAEMRRVC